MLAYFLITLKVFFHWLLLSLFPTRSLQSFCIFPCLCLFFPLFLFSKCSPCHVLLSIWFFFFSYFVIFLGIMWWYYNNRIKVLPSFLKILQHYSMTLNSSKKIDLHLPFSGELSATMAISTRVREPSQKIAFHFLEINSFNYFDSG